MKGRSIRLEKLIKGIPQNPRDRGEKYQRKGKKRWTTEQHQKKREA